MRIWRTNTPLLANPSGWVAGDLVPSVALPGTYTLRNDDGTVVSIDAATGQVHAAPAGTDDAHSQCYLAESRAQIAYATTGTVFGILIFP